MIIENKRDLWEIPIIKDALHDSPFFLAYHMKLRGFYKKKVLFDKTDSKWVIFRITLLAVTDAHLFQNRKMSSVNKQETENNEENEENEKNVEGIDGPLNATESEVNEVEEEPEIKIRCVKQLVEAKVPTNRCLNMEIWKW